MDRRTVLSAGLAFAGGALSATLRRPSRNADWSGPPPPAYSLIPVVGDGRWIWTEPPQGATGYLEPRQYELTVGVQLQGRQPARQLKATTPVPVALPEQRIDEVQTQADGCQVSLRQLTPEAGQLCLFAPSIARRQVVRAEARFRLTLLKQYHGFSREQFPGQQSFSETIRRQYMTESPGIQTRDSVVRKLAKQVASQFEHPWDKAHAFYRWVWTNIEPRLQSYTNVLTALRDRVGDCEERAAIFVAFCRASGIPARLVWVPNHNWAEFYLQDHGDQGHWIPAHTAAYPWFAWTGAHELVLQKGDRIHVPEKKKPQRLLADWMQYQGARPKVHYFAELRPVPVSEEADPGPGSRSKDAQGEWVVAGRHQLDGSLRDGRSSRRHG